MQFCLYVGKGKIKILKLSKNGKERLLATKEMSEKGPERKLATKKSSGKGQSRGGGDQKDFFVIFHNYLVY
jgi:hypothetical protein